AASTSPSSRGRIPKRGSGSPSGGAVGSWLDGVMTRCRPEDCLPARAQLRPTPTSHNRSVLMTSSQTLDRSVVAASARYCLGWPDTARGYGLNRGPAKMLFEVRGWRMRVQVDRY